jgi:hypothetical protein
MEREQDGHYGLVETLRLKAGEEANLVMRVSVRGVPVGAEMLNVVGFRTNDPAQPNGRIECIVRFVSGGVRAHPGSIVFGTVPVGGKLRRVIDVHDDALTPRRIARVISTNPDRVIARLLTEETRTGSPDSSPTGVLIGRIEIVVNQDSAGEVNEAVQIHLAGETRKPDAITVIGKVAAPIEITPTLLVLPRASMSGPIYEGICVCRSTDEQPLSISVASTLPGLTVEPLDEGKAIRRIRIKWDPIIGRGTVGGQRQVIRLQAESGKHRKSLELQLLLKG